jgi:hypothetical protein
MKSTERQKVYNKYNGKCAYTGKPLDDKWQVDHVTPKQLASYFYSHISRDAMNCKGDSVHSFENLLPTLRIVNHYKRGFDLEMFRQYMLTFHIRLAKLPINPKVEKSKNRKKYMLTVAAAFDITPDKPFSGKFYFEKTEI